MISVKQAPSLKRECQHDAHPQRDASSSCASTDVKCSTNGQNVHTGRVNGTKGKKVRKKRTQNHPNAVVNHFVHRNAEAAQSRHHRLEGLIVFFLVGFTHALPNP